MTTTIREQLSKPFPENQIEWRIGQSGKSGNKCWAKVLCYIQARAIQDRLDEVMGPENWSVSYEFPKDGGVLCNLKLKFGDEWVTKQDGAEETDIESFKGGISSALKRAGSAWGIGRYLYDMEAQWAQVEMNKSEGYDWAKTKDGTEFYWKAPQLPKWALPAADTKKDQVKGSAHVPPPEFFIVTFGEHQGKQLGNLNADELKAFYKRLMALEKKGPEEQETIDALLALSKARAAK